MNHQSLRLTPSNSPFFKNSSPKSPTKWKSEESGLRLKKIIGTTTATATGFDCLPSARQFAYTAGAAAVVSTINDDLTVSQRFLRARPTAAGLRDPHIGPWPLSPMPGDPRGRVLGSIRDQGGSGSPVGSSSRDWSDSPTGRSATAKDRVKAAVSVALSPNGQWVAIGESGYKPRVLIFSNKGESSEAPVCVLSEHTFGVHALAFSPDSKFLASLGMVNDGFIYIWTIDDRTGAATLHSSNKCTSTINVMTWIGNSVLTAGLRFVKVWRPEEDKAVERSYSDDNQLTPRRRGSEFGNSILNPRHRVLIGKNFLLGDLLDANFVTAIPINSNVAIVGAESGEVCLIDHSNRALALTPLEILEFRITAARLDGHGRLHIIGAAGQSKSFDVQELQRRGPATVKKNRRSSGVPNKMMSSITTTAMATIDDIIVELDSKRGIKLTRASDCSGDDAPVASHQLPAHNDAVLGVKCLTSFDKLPQAAFFTFSGNGSVQIWDVDGASVASLHVPVESSPDMFDLTNELRAVAQVPKSSLLAAGDKYGNLSLLDISTGSVTSRVRAHATEIIEIVTFQRETIQLIATASRDRMVQLFAINDHKLDLLQTMDEHAAAVSGLATAMDGELLLSCSTDRTVVVREGMLRMKNDPISVAFVILRTITLKSSPTSMCLGPDNEELLISTVDRSIGKYSIRNGQAGFSFKCSDMEGGEATAMSKILYTPSLNGNPTIIGVSSGDKSVRLYTEYGSLIARDWGHTEGITDVALLSPRIAEDGEESSRSQIVTVAADSTIFMWDTVSQVTSTKGLAPDTNGVAETLTASRLTLLAPPLRKVLSFSGLSHFRREKSISESEPNSPPATTIATRSPSPQRLNKKSSRAALAQPPRLEPVLRSNVAQSSRRRSLRKRSPSPSSPRSTKKGLNRKPSIGMSLRSKSSENVLNSYTSGTSTPNTTTSFGSVTASTESVCRTLRAYRKRLAMASNADQIAPDALRDLETELKLTARVIREKSKDDNMNLHETMTAKVPDQARNISENPLDERIKERAGSELMVSSEDSSPSIGTIVESAATTENRGKDIDAVTGALEKVALNA